MAWRENDQFGTQVNPDNLIGKTIIGYEFVQTDIGKTLFIYVK